MLQPSYGAGWPGEGNGESPPPLWRRLARWLPPLLVLLLSTGSYCCLMTLVLLPMVGVATPLGDEAALPLPLPPTTGWAVLVAFHVVCALALASCFKTSQLAPGAIPLWLCSREPGDQAYFHNVLQAVEKKADGSLRFCSKCGAFKPDRTHHCEQLGQCVLVLQHWSVWCNNAVGFYNHKCYLLALLYTAIVHGAVAALLLPNVVRGICDGVAAPTGLGGVGAPAIPLPPAVAALLRGGEGGVQAWALLSGSISAVLGAGALAWLLVHLSLVVRGVTAAEWWRQHSCAYRKKPKPPLAGRPFDFSARANLAKALGRHPILWLLPTNQGIEGNGIFFELSGADAPADALAARW